MRRAEPENIDGDEGAHVAAFLDFYRETAVAKVGSLNQARQRESLVPTGWNPLALLHHLACMEQRWFVWGFLGEDVGDPWRDAGSGDAWVVPEGVGLEEISQQLRATGRRTSQVLRTEPLDTVGATGGRFKENAPTLRWIGLHVLQEYARHVGHLDVAIEIAGGPVGE
ncbi:MAG: DinB family protein [Actinomycetota bacterium]|nr:DinB family protein [Actinomycetota bacterium]